eukprot:TRINITY_DN9157_c0_g1_i2.p1 TRINITY_DN9157_c0_g1~~TRINITY_DN9157_c0_g1_i2.p1  ORF type:complete len:360 (-),score=22.57 TRINITY_DN9157_c0_g1_i2:89-1168(-)
MTDGILESSWCLKEIRAAIAFKKPIIVMRPIDYRIPTVWKPSLRDVGNAVANAEQLLWMAEYHQECIGQIMHNVLGPRRNDRLDFFKAFGKTVDVAVPAEQRNVDFRLMYSADKTKLDLDAFLYCCFYYFPMSANQTSLLVHASARFDGRVKMDHVKHRPKALALRDILIYHSSPASLSGFEAGFDSCRIGTFPRGCSGKTEISPQRLRSLDSLQRFNYRDNGNSAGDILAKILDTCPNLTDLSIGLLPASRPSLSALSDLQNPNRFSWPATTSDMCRGLRVLSLSEVMLTGAGATSAKPAQLTFLHEIVLRDYKWSKDGDTTWLQSAINLITWAPRPAGSCQDGRRPLAPPRVVQVAV